MKTQLLSSLLLLGFMGCFAGKTSAQCPFDPTVVGNLLVCPDSSTTLGTQQYASYQWYSRNFLGGPSQPIPGATGQVLPVEYDQTPVYISVAATLAGCTETSPEVLVDGLFFPPMLVLTEGEFEVGPDGEQVICSGDTLYEIVLSPYTTNIQWYQGPNPIPGATNDTLVVTQPGTYWLTASPEECPNFVGIFDSMFLHVIWGDAPGCAVGTADLQNSVRVAVAPNPARESLVVDVETQKQVELTMTNAIGAPVFQAVFSGTLTIPIVELPSGIYFLALYADGNRGVWKQVIIQH